MRVFIKSFLLFLTITDGAVVVCATFAVVNLTSLCLLWLASHSFLHFLGVLQFIKFQVLKVTVTFSIGLSFLSLPIYAILWTWSKMLTLQEYKSRLVGPTVVTRDDITSMMIIISFVFTGMIFISFGVIHGNDSIEIQKTVIFSIGLVLPYTIGVMFALFTQALVVSGLLLIGYWVRQRQE